MVEFMSSFSHFNLCGQVEQQVDEPVDVEQLRGHRLAHLEGVRSSVETVEDNTLDFLPSESSTSLNIAIHRTTIKQDLIREFKDDSVLESEIQFKLINERGEIEAGVGVGVAREVYSLFWGEFSISMTIGERERVPFVRHDHYIEDWESIGRILVKGYTSVDYFPTFLSKAFICFCLFGSEVTDEMFLNSFKRYLSKSEEDLIESIVKSNELPEDTEELLDFLERFKCRSVVKKENIYRIILEIARQELVQKPHVMISAWQPILQNKLTKCLHFLSIERVMDLYEELIPTPKKVLSILSCDPKTDPQRDAFKYLQRYIRGLDNDKLSKFLQFTTGMDVMSRYTLKIAFLSTQGFSSRPIAHTCAPMLELPTAYSNFVELREEFENILNQKISWDIDIV